MEVECNLRSKKNVMEHKKGSLNDLNSSLLAKVHVHCLIHKLQLQEFHCLDFFLGGGGYYSAGDFVNMTVQFTEIAGPSGRAV